MEVYAAMVDSMDQGIGRIVASLRFNGLLGRVQLLDRARRIVVLVSRQHSGRSNPNFVAVQSLVEKFASTVGLELLLRHPLPVLEVVPVCHRVARDLVPVVPPFVHERVVRVRMGYEMCRPEQRCHKNSKLFCTLHFHGLL